MKHPTLFVALWLVGCLEAKDNALFGSSSAAAGGSLATDAGGSAATRTGTGSRSASGGAKGGEAAAGATPEGGAMATTDDAPGTASGGALGGNAGGGGEREAPRGIESCDMLGGAVVNEVNGHCYRVNFENLTFTAARDACRSAGGHLATISDVAENDFVRDVHDGEHWLGATDGRADTTPGAGTYSWVDGEAWSFADWEDEQPNAYETNCPGQDDESDCFEHCAFQSDDGDWNDRSCWHTVVSVCEWDVAARAGDPGGAGPGGAGL